MKQSRLSFTTVTAAEAAVQRATTAQRFILEHPPLPIPPPTPPPRRPGRPRSATTVLAAAAAALGPADEPEESEKKKARGKYTDWFTSPYINDILQMYKRTGYNARKTVSILQQEAPDSRYDRLAHTSILRWHDDDHKLLPCYQQQLDLDIALSKYRGRPAALSAYPEVEHAMKETLARMREAGTPMNTHVIKWVVRAIFMEQAPSLLDSLQLTQGWISKWVTTNLKWSYRKATTAASKTPLDWEDKRIDMAKRIAATMAMYNIHSSLVINLDQTGVHLIPASDWTYEEKNTKGVATVGQEDKRQITVVLASSLYGDLLPLQMIFQGKTDRSLPESTAQIQASRAHLTHSDNHWSNVDTMKQYISKIIVPYTERCINRFELASDAKVLLLLDVWKVHTCEEFRKYLRTHHPRIHLVYVPANCTKYLQPADVALQRPFKHGIKKRFNEWGAKKIYEQLQLKDYSGFSGSFKISVLKPLVTQWCLESAKELEENHEALANAWYRAVVSLYDVKDPQRRQEALVAVAEKKLEVGYVPEKGEEQGEDEGTESEHEEDEEKDELDTAKPIRQGTRRSNREKQQARPYGYQIASSAIAMTSDSER